MRIGSTLLMACLLALGLGCGDDDGGTDAGGTDAGTDSMIDMDTGGGDDAGDDDAGAETRSLTFSFDGLPVLGDEYVYEGWIIVDDAPVTTGRFTIDEEGALDPATFEVDAAMVDAATVFVLTIEPATGDDPAPADTHVLAGTLDSGSAILGIDHMAALGDDFTGATGTFLLATPSSAATDDNDQGIWFITPGDPMTPGFTLPELPAGWVYEGWVVDTSGESPVPTSTGRFTDPAAADDDAGGPAAGPEDTPPFPGADFIDPATVLTADHMAVLSIEPDPDDSPGPFQLKPLGLPIGTDVGPTNPYTMNNIITENGISGTATFE